MPFRRYNLILFLLLSVDLYGQYDTEGLSISVNADQWFVDQIGIQKTTLLTGSYFPLNIESTNTFPFFLNRDWIVGKIEFQNQVFVNVNLRYQVEEDIVLTNNPTDIRQYHEPILLNRDHIKWFELDGHRFEKFTPRLQGMKHGFYEVIYDSDQITFLAKRRKRLIVTEGNLEYVNSDLFILLTGDKDYVIKSRGGWLKLFKDLKQDIKNSTSQYEIKKFKNAKHEHLILLAKCTSDLLNRSR